MPRVGAPFRPSGNTAPGSPLAVLPNLVLLLPR